MKISAIVCGASDIAPLEDQIILLRHLACPSYPCLCVLMVCQGYVVCPSDKRFLLLFTFLKKNRKKKIMVRTPFLYPIFVGLTSSTHCLTPRTETHYTGHSSDLLLALARSP